MDKTLIFQKSDFQNFREWLNLDKEAITWQGRYEDEFNKFWEFFFIDQLSLKQVMERFQFAAEKVKVGPLASWFEWLGQKFLLFVFLNKSLNLAELAEQSGLSAPHIALDLRSQFIDQFPHWDDFFNMKFQLGNIASENLYLSFASIQKELGLNKEDIQGSGDEEIMRSLEVTLYSEWKDFQKGLEHEMFHPRLDFKKLKEKASLRKQIKFVEEAIVLFFVGWAAIWAITKFNVWYEKNLADKISILEPDFMWLNKTLTFKDETKKPTKIPKKLEELEALISKKEDRMEFKEEERYETESEVVLTSLEAMPRDLVSANLEQFDYEELKKQNAVYRDNVYGNKLVYRVMLKSVDTVATSGQLGPLLKNYKVSQVDNVRPGTSVPGGVYYNLFVPTEHLKEFLTQVLDIGEAVLYESRTKWGNVPGKNKVFIWIKEI